MPIEVDVNTEDADEIPPGFLRLIVGFDTNVRYKFVHCDEIASYGPDFTLDTKGIPSDQTHERIYLGPNRTVVRLRGMDKPFMVAATSASLSQQIADAQRKSMHQRNTVQR